MSVFNFVSSKIYKQWSDLSSTVLVARFSYISVYINIHIELCRSASSNNNHKVVLENGAHRMHSPNELVDQS